MKPMPIWKVFARRVKDSAQFIFTGRDQAECFTKPCYILSNLIHHVWRMKIEISPVCGFCFELLIASVANTSSVTRMGARNSPSFFTAEISAVPFEIVRFGEGHRQMITRNLHAWATVSWELSSQSCSPPWTSQIYEIATKSCLASLPNFGLARFDKFEVWIVGNFCCMILGLQNCRGNWDNQCGTGK